MLGIDRIRVEESHDGVFITYNPSDSHFLLPASLVAARRSYIYIKQSMSTTSTFSARMLYRV
jgi:hypothetical protein